MPQTPLKGKNVADEKLNEEIIEVSGDGTDFDAAAEADVDIVDETADAVPPQYGVGPLSAREALLLGVWLAAFIVSFSPIAATIAGPGAALTMSFGSVWTQGLSWVLSIGLPTAAVFLLLLRRFSPQGIRRVGSLGIDQFASVAFSVAAMVWLSWTWETVAVAMQSGIWIRSWVMWVELVLMLAGVVLTVFAPLIPALAQDFQYRPESPAHRNARAIRPVTRAPRPPRPAPKPAAVVETEEVVVDEPAAGVEVVEETTIVEAAAAEAAADIQSVTDETVVEETVVDEPVDEPVEVETVSEVEVEAEPVEEVEEVAAAPVRQQAFWALVPEDRDIVDEAGAVLFTIGPTAWALVIEDRGDSYVVRHEDGRIGFLNDVSGVTRG